MFERIMGIVTLKPPTYKTVAEDPAATKQAMLIVIVVSLIQGFVVGLVTPGGVSIGNAVIRAILSLGLGFVSWYVTAWLLATIAKAFGGNTDINEMLRVTGFVAIFNLAVLLNLAGLISSSLLCVTSIIGIVILVLSLIGYVIGVREAAEFSTGNAVVTALIAAVASFLISLAGSMIAGLF